MSGGRDNRATKVKAISTGAALAAALALFATGCAQHNFDIPALPGITKDNRQFLTKEQQAKAIEDMAREKDAAKAAAEKQIEKR